MIASKFRPGFDFRLDLEEIFLILTFLFLYSAACKLVTCVRSSQFHHQSRCSSCELMASNNNGYWIDRHCPKHLCSSWQGGPLVRVETLRNGRYRFHYRPMSPVPIEDLLQPPSPPNNAPHGPPNNAPRLPPNNAPRLPPNNAPRGPPNNAPPTIGPPNNALPPRGNLARANQASETRPTVTSNASGRRLVKNPQASVTGNVTHLLPLLRARLTSSNPAGTVVEELAAAAAVYRSGRSKPNLAVSLKPAKKSPRVVGPKASLMGVLAAQSLGAPQAQSSAMDATQAIPATNILDEESTETTLAATPEESLTESALADRHPDTSSFMVMEAVETQGMHDSAMDDCSIVELKIQELLARKDELDKTKWRLYDDLNTCENAIAEVDEALDAEYGKLAACSQQRDQSLTATASISQEEVDSEDVFFDAQSELVQVPEVVVVTADVEPNVVPVTHEQVPDPENDTAEEEPIVLATHMQGPKPVNVSTDEEAMLQATTSTVARKRKHDGAVESRDDAAPPARKRTKSGERTWPPLRTVKRRYSSRDTQPFGGHKIKPRRQNKKFKPLIVKFIFPRTLEATAIVAQPTQFPRQAKNPAPKNQKVGGQVTEDTAVRVQNKMSSNHGAVVPDVTGSAPAYSTRSRTRSAAMPSTSTNTSTWPDT
ncbi:hypothetical protein B566_EDAN014876, partial [Ephemera danica]